MASDNASPSSDIRWQSPISEDSWAGTFLPDMVISIARPSPTIWGRYQAVPRVGGKPQVDKGAHEVGSRIHHPQITAEGDPHPGPGGGAVDGGHRRRRRLMKRLDQGMEMAVEEGFEITLPFPFPRSVR